MKEVSITASLHQPSEIRKASQARLLARSRTDGMCRPYQIRQTGVKILNGRRQPLIRAPGRTPWRMDTTSRPSAGAGWMSRSTTWPVLRTEFEDLVTTAWTGSTAPAIRMLPTTTGYAEVATGLPHDEGSPGTGPGRLRRGRPGPARARAPRVAPGPRDSGPTVDRAGALPGADPVVPHRLPGSKRPAGRERYRPAASPTPHRAHE